MDIKDLAYIAGLIDAEGCLRIVPKKIGKHIRYKPTITIGISDRCLLEWLTTLFPTTIHHQVKMPPHKDMYIVKYQCIKTEHILSLIYPYLRVKRKQADLLIRCFDIKHAYKQGSHVSLKPEYTSLNQQCSQLKKLHASDYIELPKVSLQQKEYDLAYLGGLIDGDGSIINCEINIKRPDRDNRIYTRIYRSLRIMMNQPEGMLVLSSLFGGNITRCNKNTCFLLQLGGESLRKALPEIIPYLKLKKDKAIKLLEDVNS